MFKISFTLNGVFNEWVFDTYNRAKLAAGIIKNRYGVQVGVYSQNLESGSRNFRKADLMRMAA